MPVKSDSETHDSRVWLTRMAIFATFQNLAYFRIIGILRVIALNNLEVISGSFFSFVFGILKFCFKAGYFWPFVKLPF